MSSNRGHHNPIGDSWPIPSSSQSSYAVPGQFGNQQLQDSDSPPMTPPLVPGNTYSPPMSPESVRLGSPMNTHTRYSRQAGYLADPEAHLVGEGRMASGLWCSSPLEQQVPEQHNDHLFDELEQLVSNNNQTPTGAHSQPVYVRDNQGTYGQPSYMPRPGRKRALCIGVNYVGQHVQLEGCINDVHNIASFLTAQFGYRAENIRKLTDDATNPSYLPTRDNILAAMHWLVEDAQPTDSLFFHFSGHGGQTKDLDGDEEDVIYPLDFEHAGHIVDDDINEIMVQPLLPGCRLTAIFDCSHSGSALDLPYTYSTDGKLKEYSHLADTRRGLRSFGKSCVRGDMSSAIKGLSNVIRSPSSRRVRKEATQRSRELRGSEAHVISWSACKDSEKSDDAFEGHEAVGAMSHAFIQSLRQKPRQSYRELLTNVREILRSRYDQKPQLSSSHPIDTNNCWDNVYNTEIENFETNGDEGEVWFGEETVDKMLDWTLENCPADTKPYVLDIGTGNGIMTVTLAENGYDSDRLVGIDYRQVSNATEPSVKLARAVANGRGHSAIRYVVSDFINEAAPTPVEGESGGKWDLLLDKGTYDAIALSGKSEDGKTTVSRYPPKVAEALKSGGMFLITSCNFTEDELKESFGVPELGLTYHSRIQHPTYTYGGSSGSICSSVAFKKN